VATVRGMKRARLSEMMKGWFVGDFEPAIARSTACEVAVKHHAAGDYEEIHHHRIATEVTVVVSGRVKIMGKILDPGDIVLLEPGEATDFFALTDAVCAVVKLPSARGDRYPGHLPLNEVVRS
jgi:mannose-6-phosphate isomerase-like protein (cupin superfamily)